MNPILVFDIYFTIGVIVIVVVAIFVLWKIYM